jgi:hypothetical protein
MAASSQTQFTSLNDQNTSTPNLAFVAGAAGKLYVESQLVTFHVWRPKFPST